MSQFASQFVNSFVNQFAAGESKGAREERDGREIKHTLERSSMRSHAPCAREGVGGGRRERERQKLTQTARQTDRRNKR